MQLTNITNEREDITKVLTDKKQIMITNEREDLIKVLTDKKQITKHWTALFRSI